ncbi:ornithine cyclodeaminase family protein [Zobellella iuensis]|uniref:Ornithine cyclodeaminase family protein n=1 Tax=Zobellella iuensis TaxID=2803811 RepID=A0ABS1QNL6_9GAMM|nr:ornithine cyclodeaminase family protein [Zobellella iuensis]MBL1376066.1 ornithine cyclodeaminase family protein [Zobellella iuensis]
MQVISAEQVSQGLDWTGLITKIEQTFRDGIQAPPRHHHSINRPDGEATMLLMPAWEDNGYIGIKMLNVFPQNAAQGLASISGLYLLSDGRTGHPLACIDGNELTRRRTAAASALAARYLARQEADTLLIVGTGQVAPMLIEAHAAVRPIRHVRIWGRNADKTQAMAQQYRHYAQGMRPFESVEVVTDLATACRTADIVSCATLSTEPLIRGKWLRPGCHLDLVGAFRPDMRESDADCVAGAEVFVDTYAGARGEAGDLHQAIAEGRFNMDDIQADLARLTRGEHPGRADEHSITLFKSVGASLEDLAAAIHLWEGR